MTTFIGKISFRVFLVCLILLVLASMSAAKLYIETDTVTGIVADIKNNVITLDSGIQYFPARDHMDLNIQVGAYATLRFYIDAAQKYWFIDAAAGENSLIKSKPQEEKPGGFK